MMGDETRDAIWRQYDLAFREDAHQLLAWGHLDSCRLITPQQEETEITGFIVEAIQSRLDSFTTPARFEKYCVKEDNPVSGEGRTGKKRRRIDIIIEATRPRPRPRYVFEAKRLCRPSNTIGKYVGSEGMMRFISGRYAAECPEVAMIGYVQTDTAEYWFAELENHFSKDSAEGLYITAKLTQVSVTADLKDAWVSRHTRKSGNQLAIFHVLLNCSAQANEIGLNDGNQGRSRRRRMPGLRTEWRRTSDA